MALTPKFPDRVQALVRDEVGNEQGSDRQPAGEEWAPDGPPTSPLPATCCSIHLEQPPQSCGWNIDTDVSTEAMLLNLVAIR
jgi:hypothetical protein